eukprot:972852_1
MNYVVSVSNPTTPYIAGDPFADGQGDQFSVQKMNVYPPDNSDILTGRPTGSLSMNSLIKTVTFLVLLSNSALGSETRVRQKAIYRDDRVNSQPPGSGDTVNSTHKYNSLPPSAPTPSNDTITKRTKYRGTNGTKLRSPPPRKSSP